MTGFQVYEVTIKTPLRWRGERVETEICSVHPDSTAEDVVAMFTRRHPRSTQVEARAIAWPQAEGKE